MKEMTKFGERLPALTKTELIYGILYHILGAACTFFLSRVCIAGKMLPFGIAMLSGCPQVMLPGCIFGAVAGYFFPANLFTFGVFRYVAACLAVTGIRVMACSVSSVGKRVWFCLFTALVTTLVTGIVAPTTTENAYIFTTIEAVLAAGGAYFCHFACIAVRRKTAARGPREMTSAIIVLTLIAAGAVNVSLAGISLGKILGCGLILAAARYGGVFSSVVCGGALSAASALTGGDTLLSFAYLFGSIVAGLFRDKGRHIQLISFVLTLGALFLSLGINEKSLVAVCELFFGAALFLIIPKGVGIALSKVFSSSFSVVQPPSLKSTVTMRLSFAASALRDVSLTVHQVARELSKINTPSFSGLVQMLKVNACKDCPNFGDCWQKNREQTTEFLSETLLSTKNGTVLRGKAKKTEATCLKLEHLRKEAAGILKDYDAQVAAENRIQEVRGTLCDQFEGISDMLSEMVNELNCQEHYEAGLASRLGFAFKELGLDVKECVCKTDKFGRLSVDAAILDSGFGAINKMQIMRSAGAICDRDFDVPTVKRSGGEINLSIRERARLFAEVGAEQISSSGTMCGDSYNWFNDGKGRLVLLLSDGMGCGGRAAVDSAMATGLFSRLVKAGFGFDCALKILNSSMLFKSTDESLTTVDVACLDLFTGTLDLLKAGAAPTFVRRNGITGKAQSTSLPAGILREIGFDKGQVKIGSRDIILMVSDGAIGEDNEWICKELEKWGNDTAQHLAEHIAHLAKEKRSDGHTDDITVIAAIISRA